MRNIFLVSILLYKVFLTFHHTFSYLRTIKQKDIKNQSKMFLLYCIVAVFTTVQAVQFTFVNNHPSTIWVGSLGNDGKPPVNEGGWEMAAGSQVTVDVDGSWAGRFWARTGCNFDENGNGHCDTGDCGNVLKCNGAGGAPPVTLAEITLQGSDGNDFYDISNVDGFNIPVTFAPTDKSGSGYDCSEASCTANINNECPDDLRQVVNGETVGCKSACLAFDTDQYCCRNSFGTPDTCKASDWPQNYPEFFKQRCPDAYSYAYDDQKSTFTCSDTGYKIVFG
ncbi:uncharacterized protein [Anabrus simplex]|uniref:uncharacterized protein n=1 Tax=Anabrus simplex TaxID=316456 RepID=UPI0035A32F03